MNKYRITVTETKTRDFIVKAGSEEAAHEKLRRDYEERDYFEDDSDTDTEYTIVSLGKCRSEPTR